MTTPTELSRRPVFCGVARPPADAGWLLVEALKLWSMLLARTQRREEAEL